MEAVGAGASVMTLVVVALQVAKRTYETLSSIKDGPDIVIKVASRFNQIFWILENLRRSRVALHDAALAQHLELCVAELRTASELVQKLQPPPHGPSSGRLWKRLRTFLNEGDLERINVQLIGLITTLNLRLHSVSSDLVYDLKMDIGALHQLVQTQTNPYISNYVQYMKCIDHDIDKSPEMLHDKLVSLQREIEKLRSSSQSQSSTMVELLTEIKTLISTKAGLRNEFRNGSIFEEMDLEVGESSIPSSRVHNSVSNEMTRNIDFLCKFIGEEGRSIDTYNDDSHDSEICDQIIEALRYILKFAASQEEMTSSQSSPSETGPSDKYNAQAISRRFSRAFGQQRLDINQRTGLQRIKNGQIVARKHSYHRVSLDVGELTMRLDRTRHTFATKKSTPALPEHYGTDYNMSAVLMPHNTDKYQMIITSTIQQELQRGVISSISSLSVNRVIPEGSPIFKVVELGNLKILKKMLAAGEASLRDHDEHGASLLMNTKFSMEQPEICKFLVEGGLNVDHVGGICMNHRTYKITALQTKHMDHNIDSHAIERRLSCRRLILEAGADPTLSFDEDDVSHLKDIAFHGTPESIRLAFNPDLIGHLSSINHCFGDGLTPLLQHCMNYGGYSHQCLRAMISMGADCTARDDLGRSCLHICISSLKQPETSRELEAICMLIRSGADPRAVDLDGTTVSEYAYDLDRRHPEYGGLGVSYAGDLWDSALQSCAYDIREFRCVHRQRTAGYSQTHGRLGFIPEYTRKDFERLWRGREELCPYWDDEPWPGDCGKQCSYERGISDTGHGLDSDSDKEGDRLGSLGAPGLVGPFGVLGLFGLSGRSDNPVSVGRDDNALDKVVVGIATEGADGNESDAELLTRLAGSPLALTSEVAPGEVCTRLILVSVEADMVCVTGCPLRDPEGVGLGFEVSCRESLVSRPLDAGALDDSSLEVCVIARLLVLAGALEDCLVNESISALLNRVVLVSTTSEVSALVKSVLVKEVADSEVPALVASAELPVCVSEITVSVLVTSERLGDVSALPLLVLIVTVSVIEVLGIVSEVPDVDCAEFATLVLELTLDVVPSLTLDDVKPLKVDCELRAEDRPVIRLVLLVVGLDERRSVLVC
ncbi:Palmitoyltransferase akr1 [Paramyrothecium foliicola]|nr:Palmitoyltransferase akr1 [Paramyrothecium foliicola]